MDSTASPSVTFQLLPDDIAAFRRHLSGAGNLSSQRMVPLLLALCLFIIAAGVALRARPRVSPTFGAPVSLGLSLTSLLPLFLPLALFVFFYVLIPRTKMGINTKAPIFQHLNEATLLPDAFSHSFGATTTLVRWDGIENIIATPTHLFVFTLPQDGYPIPRRAFASDDDFAAFSGLARHKWQQARPEIPPIAHA